MSGGPDEPPRLETERLRLRVPREEDAERMAAFVRANREHFAASEPVRPDAYFTAGFWGAELRRRESLRLDGTWLQLVLLERDDPEGDFAGQCALSQITRGPLQSAFLGYGLDRRRVGRGLMREALTAVIGYAFETLNLHRIQANHVPENERSARVLQALGFEREGLAREYLRLGGRWRDHVLTSRINPGWRSPEEP